METDPPVAGSSGSKRTANDTGTEIADPKRPRINLEGKGDKKTSIGPALSEHRGKRRPISWSRRLNMYWRWNLRRKNRTKENGKGRRQRLLTTEQKNMVLVGWHGFITWLNG